MPGGKRPVSDGEREYHRLLGAVIQELRAIGTVEEGPGMSQARLAELLNRSEAALSRWENGKAGPSSYDLHEIARIFDVPADALIWPEEKPLSPVRQMMADRIEAGGRRGQARDGQQRGAA